MSIESRVRALEAEPRGWQTCAMCRPKAGLPCRHVGLLLSLLPRIESGSDKEWHETRALGRRVLMA
jgi:hypothetical protein